MGRQQISQVLGYAGLALLVVGAGLYAVNSPQRNLTYAAVASGLILLLAFAGLNWTVIVGYVGRRSSRYGANMAAAIVLFSCIVVIVQALAARHSVRYDTTRDKRFSLAGQTLNVLAGLERDLELFAFFATGTVERDYAESLLDQYAHHSTRIHYELIDPDQKPARAREFEVKTPGTTVVRYGKRSEHLTRISEDILTNTILKLTREEAKAVYFVWGHGERDISSQEAFGYSIMKSAIEKENYVGRAISLFEEQSVPEDCEVLVIAGPKKDYLAGEIAKIEDYLSGGGNALFMMDPVETLPLLEGVLTRYRALLEQDVVIDPFSRVSGRDFTVPVVREYVEHPITLPMNEVTLFPVARSVNISATDVTGVRAQYLMLASKSAWGEIDLDSFKRGTARMDDEDIAAPIALAMISTRTYENGEPMEGGADESKIVLFGDSDFAANSSFRILGNGDLLLNTINFLAEEKDLIAIRTKETLGDRLFLTASQGRFIFLLCVVLLPVAVISFGTTVFMRRRRTA
jgi:ABC-type uncharacterized transport system involved in gliding motility auxiliary subunit